MKQTLLAAASVVILSACGSGEDAANSDAPAAPPEKGAVTAPDVSTRTAGYNEVFVVRHLRHSSRLA